MLHASEMKQPAYCADVARAVANARVDGLLMIPAQSTKAGIIMPNPNPNTASPTVIIAPLSKTAWMSAPAAVATHSTGKTARVESDLMRE